MYTQYRVLYGSPVISCSLTAGDQMLSYLELVRIKLLLQPGYAPHAYSKVLAYPYSCMADPHPLSFYASIQSPLWASTALHCFIPFFDSFRIDFVADPDPKPDPTFDFDADPDPDPAFHSNADPDPDPASKIIWIWFRNTARFNAFFWTIVSWITGWLDWIHAFKKSVIPF